jgi:hypothetical protein
MPLRLTAEHHYDELPLGRVINLARKIHCLQAGNHLVPAIFFFWLFLCILRDLCGESLNFDLK